VRRSAHGLEGTLILAREVTTRRVSRSRCSCPCRRASRARQPGRQTGLIPRHPYRGTRGLDASKQVTTPRHTDLQGHNDTWEKSAPQSAPQPTKKTPPRHRERASDLRSPVTESNRRPSPYHFEPNGYQETLIGSEQARRWLTLALASWIQRPPAPICHSKCHSASGSRTHLHVLLNRVATTPVAPALRRPPGR
jgi:hypothetical protein